MWYASRIQITMVELIADLSLKRAPSLISRVAQACRKWGAPHFRHTSAMVVLQATGDIRKVSLWLGHEDIHTTEVYLRADPTEKLEAMSEMVPLTLKRGRFRAPDKLIASLRRGVV